MSSFGVVPAGSSVDEATDGIMITDEHGRRRKRRRKRLIAGLAVLVVAGGGAGTWLVTRSGSAGATTAHGGITTTTELVAAKTGTMKTTVAASGTLAPADEADLSFAVSGAVTSVKVTEGEQVKVGQVLATVGTTALSDDLSEAGETLTSARAALATAEDDDDAATEIDQDEATVTDDELDVTDARADLADAQLDSTIDGEVSTVGLAVGDEVTGSGSSSTGAASSDTATSDTSTSDTATSDASSDTSGSTTDASSDDIEVVSTGRFVVSADVDDTEVGKVKVGDPVVITPSESTGTVDGTVASVGLVASDSTDVAEFPVDIVVDGVHDSLYAGASATVSIVVKELEHVVEIPTAAIAYTGGNATVTESDNGKRATKTITTGATLDDETQVTSGLVAGDKVVERVVEFKTGGKTGKSIFGGTSSGDHTGYRGGGAAPSGAGTDGGGFTGGDRNG